MEGVETKMDRVISDGFEMLCIALVCAIVLGGCASSGSNAPKMAPPPDSRLTMVEPGMDEMEVREVLGDPDDANMYQTGKQWIPFYFGTDTYRTDWIYEGLGRVVYSRNHYSGALKVIEVVYNPDAR